MLSENDTIVALASAPGRGAIAVIRLNGSRAFEIISKTLAQKDVDQLSHRSAKVVNLYDDASKDDREILDQCVIVPYVGPASYTGEDLVEIFSHGGRIVPSLIIETLIRSGARLAEPGEFTRRAFLNNKLDLAQSESIDAIISATSRSEFVLAQQQYSGQFSREVKELRSQLLDLLGLLELELDFSEEDVEFASRDELQQRLAVFKEMLVKLLKSYDRAHILREGVRVAIVGKPNVGKSSFLNLLLKRDRAIVTDIPGTTRDVLEESIDIGGYKFVFTDTAGIRDAEDIVELEGIRRSREAIKSANIVLFLVDQSRGIDRDDLGIKQVISEKTIASADKLMLLIRNKSDQPSVLDQADLDNFFEKPETFTISCVTGSGVDSVEKRLSEFAKDFAGDFSAQEPALINLRQRQAAQKSLEAVTLAMDRLVQNFSPEFISSELRIALEYLGELIGEISTEDILGNIFSKFCIGK